MPGRVKFSQTQDAKVRIRLQTEGFAALSDPRLSNSAKMRRKCCYGQEKNLGQYSSLSLSPLILHTQQNIILSKIKCERFIFLLEVYSFVIEVVHYQLIIFVHICVHIIYVCAHIIVYLDIYVYI